MTNNRRKLIKKNLKAGESIALELKTGGFKKIFLDIKNNVWGVK